MQASAELAKFEAEVKALEDKAHVVRLSANITAATADLVKLDTEIRALTDPAHVVRFGADTAAATADLVKLSAEVKALSDSAHAVKFGTAAETAGAAAKLAELDAELKALTDQIRTVKIAASGSDATGKIAEIDAEIRALTGEPHVVRISAVFDDADIGLARRDFMLLDNAISYDAMQRLRSSPQGSVLGALNALFSPHPVIGGPSPEQSATNGLLGQMFAAQGGGDAVAPGSRGGSGTGAVLLQDVTAGNTVVPQDTGAAVVAGQAAAAQSSGDLAVAAEAEKAAAAEQGTAAAAEKDAAGRMDTAAMVLKAAGADQAEAAGELRGAAGDLRDTALSLGALGSLFSGLQQSLAQQSAAAEAAAAAAGRVTGGGGGGNAAAAAAGGAAAPHGTPAATDLAAVAAAAAGSSAAPHGTTPASTDLAAAVAAAAGSSAAAGHGTPVATDLTAATVAATVSNAGAAADAVANLDTQIRKAYDDYAALVGELNDMREPAIIAALPDFNQFDQVMRKLGKDLEALDQPGAATAQAVADIQMRLEAAGVVLDDFETVIPTVTSSLGKMDTAMNASAVAATRLGDRYANVSAEMAALGAPKTAAAAAGGGSSGQSATASLLAQAVAAKSAAEAAQYAAAAEKLFTGQEKGVAAAAKDAAVKLEAISVAAKDAAVKLGEMAAASSSGTDAARYATAAAAAQAIATEALGVGAKNAANNVGFLKQHISLFGGALGAIPVIGTITGIELLIHAAIELAAVVVPATLAFVAWGAAAVPTVQSIYEQMKAVYTTSTALGQSIYPLTGGFSKMVAAAKPSVIQLFGDALAVAGASGGKLIPIITQVGTVMERLGGRAAAAMANGMGTLFKTGPADLAKFGDIIGNIFGMAGNLIKQMPGYAEILLGALDDVTKAIEAITASPITGWFLKIGLLAHGAILWGGLLITGFTLVGNAALGLVQKFGILKGAEIGLLDTTAMADAFKAIGLGLASVVADLAGLDAAWVISEGAATAWAGVMDALAAINPVGWFALAATAIAGLVYLFTRGGNAVGQFGTALNNAISTGSVTSSINTVNTGIAQVTQQMNDAKASAARYQQELNALPSGYARGSGPMMTLNRNIATQNSLYSQSKNELASLKGYQDNYNTLLKAAGGNVSLLNAAGITSNAIMTANAGTMAQYTIEVQGAADAQKALGLGIGRAAAAVNAQTNNFMTDTLPAMQKVTQAEDAIMNVITSGQSALDTFEQGIGTLAQNFDTATKSGATVNTTLGTLKASASLAGASLGGTTTASYALNSAFYQQIQNGQKLIDAMAQQGASTAQLKTAVATVAGQMLSFAGNNAEARAVIVDLINNALGPGTVSLQSMNSWVGHNVTSLAGMNSLMAQVTASASQMAGVLQSNLNQMLAQAAADAYGGQKALDSFAQGVLHGDNAAVLLANDGGAQVLAMFKNMYQGDLPKAENAFVSWAKNGLGLSQTAAVNLWNELQANLNPAIDLSGHTAAQSATQIEDHFIKDLDYLGANTPIVAGAIGQFTDMVLATGTTSTQTAGARAQLIKDLHAAGVDAQTAASLVQGLQDDISGMHGTSVSVDVVANGSGGVTAVESLPGMSETTARLVLGGLAAGGYVTGGTPGKDSVLAMLMPGEVVVPAHMVSGGAVDHLRGKIPGFAHGGLVNFVGSNESTFAGDWGKQFASAALAQLQAAVKKQQQQYIDSVLAGGGNGLPLGSGPLSASAATAQAFARSIMFAYGWTQAQFPYLQALWQRESGWNSYAVNPSSGAAGIPQNINGWSAYAPGDYQAQVRWGDAYISGRYGTPQAAWAHEMADGWYHGGGLVGGRLGVLGPDDQLAAVRTGEFVMNPAATSRWLPVLQRMNSGLPAGTVPVMSSGQQPGGGSPTMVPGGGDGASAATLSRIEAGIRELVQVTRQAPAATGEHVGAVIGGSAGAASFRSRYPRGVW